MIQPTNEQMTKNLYPQSGGANAVSINIYNPQAYGSVPQNTQQPPYNYTNSVYQMPSAEIYNPVNQAPAVPSNYFLPTPPQQAPVVMNQNPQPIIAPSPNMMPDSVIPASQVATPQTNAPQGTEAQQVATPEAAGNEQNNIPTVDTEALIKDLKSNDPSFKGEAINKIAEYAQEKPEIALQVVSEPVMQALVDVIKEDTTSLEGPNDKQIEIAEKISKGEQLTPEEEALSEQLSPRDLANKNRIFALYTLAMIQKLQRDELNQYIETQKANGEETIEPLSLEELIGYGDMVNVINNDQRPEVKVAAIQALEHVAQADEKAKVQELLQNALNSNDEPVKQAAQEALSKFEA